MRELDEVALLPLCWYPLLFPDVIEKRVKQLHVCPDVDLQCLCWDVVRSRSLAISQLLDSSLNLLLCGCTTVNRYIADSWLYVRRVWEGQVGLGASQNSPSISSSTPLG